jgi:hypothetical protein
MKFKPLTQIEIDNLDEHQYSMFLAYGDTFTDPKTSQVGGRGVELWEGEASRLIAEASREKLCISKCVWNSKYLSGIT